MIGETEKTKTSGFKGVMRGRWGHQGKKTRLKCDKPLEQGGAVSTHILPLAATGIL